MYRGNYGPPVMGPGPGGYEGAVNGSSAKKKKRVKTPSSPADLLERIQKRLRSENFFDTNESDAMASPSSSNSGMNFNSNQQHNSFSGGPGQANAPGDMMLPRPLLPTPHPPHHSILMHSSHDYSYSGQHGNDYQPQQPELHPKHSAEAQSSDGRRNLSSRLGPPALAGNEMDSGRESVPFIPGLGDDVEMTGSEGFPSVAPPNKPSITDFLDESFNSQDLEPARTDYWKYGVSESSSTSTHSKSSRAHSSESPAPDLQKTSVTEFKSGRSGTINFLDNASRGQKNSAYGSTFGKDRSSAYSGSDSSRRPHQKISVSDYSSTSDKRGRASSRGLQNRDSPARSRHVSPFLTKSGRTGSLLLPSGAASGNRAADISTTSTKSGRTGSLLLPVNCAKEKNRGASSKWEKRLSGYEKCLGNESGLSKNWKRSSEGREKESTFPVPDDIGITIDHASEIDIPREALQCHVCRLQNFSNHHAYNKHLLSPHHQHMSQLLGVRNDNLEAFKRSAAKLSSRALEYEVLDDGSIKEMQDASGSNFIRCSYCYATVLNTAVDAHDQLLQHKELVEFTRPLCCGIKFINRRSYESHKNTTKHLVKKFAKEKEFISRVICQIDEETIKSKMSQSKAGGKKLSHNSLNIPQSTYIQRVLEKLVSDPCIQDEKSNYCLVCEVSVPEFRRTFHPSCSDHHENKHVFYTVNKSRITGLIAKVLSRIDQPNKSRNTGVSDQNKLGRDSLSSKVTSHTEKLNATAAPEVEGGEDFEYDFECVPSVAEGNNKSRVETKQIMSTSDGEKVRCSQPTVREPALVEHITTATSDANAITEPTDMEIASSAGSVEDGKFEYEFSGAKTAMDAIPAKPVVAVQGEKSEVKQTIKEEKRSKGGKNDEEGDEEFDYEFSSIVSELDNIVSPTGAVTTETTDKTSSKLPSDKEVSVQSKTSTVAYSSVNKTEKSESNSLELGHVQNRKSEGIDEAREEFYVECEDTDVLKGAAPLQKMAAPSTDELQAQEEKDIDDEIDEFDYQFDAPASKQSLPTAQASTSASLIDAIVTGDAPVEPVFATMKTLIQTRNNDRDESSKVTAPIEASTEEDEFEYHIEEENVPDDGHLKSNRVTKTNESEDEAIDGQNDEEKVSENSEFEYQMKGKKSSEEDEFEYQMEEEKKVEMAETVNQSEENTTGEDEFEYEVEEDVADESEFEYQLDDKADDEEEFEYEVEEKFDEKDEFEYQMEDEKVAEEGKVNEISPVLAVKQVCNEVQDELCGEDEFEYQMEEHDLKESKGSKEKNANNVEVKSNETDDKVAEESSDLDYEKVEETENGNSVKNEVNEGGDAFEYQIEDDTVAEDDEFDYKLDETNKENDSDTNAEDDEFEYNLIDNSDTVENTVIPNTVHLCDGKDPSESGEEEEYAFDYELPDDEVHDDPTQSATSKICMKEASEVTKTTRSDELPGKENTTKIVELDKKDAEHSAAEFDYDVEEYETEISTVSGALGKVSDEVKKQIAEDNNSSDDNTSSNLSSEKIESTQSSPLKFKIPSVAPYSSDAAHDAVYPDLCENDKSANILSASDKTNVLKHPEETSSADTQTTAVAFPAKVSATPSARTPSVSPKQSLGKSPVRISTRTLSRSPARGSATSPASLPASSLNLETATSPVRANTSARNSVAFPTLTATVSADLVTEAKEKVEHKKKSYEFEESVNSSKNIVRDDIEDQDDVECALPKDSEIVESLKIKSEQDVLSDEIEESKQAVESNLEAVESLASKSIKVENVKNTPVKVDVVDSENVKKISEENEDDEATTKSRITKGGRARSSRSTPVKAIGVVPVDNGKEPLSPVSQRVGAKRGRVSTHAAAAEEESQESEELLVTPGKRPARNRGQKQEVKDQSKDVVEILLEVIDEEDSSPQKKGRVSKRNIKERTVILADSVDDASETLPASNHEEEEEEMKKDEQNMTSLRGSRGSRARRGNSTKFSPKNLSVSLDAEEDPTGEGSCSGGRKRKAPSNSDDEGSVCSVTRGGRPSKRGRGEVSTRGAAIPKTPAASSRKTAAVTKTPAARNKATPAASVTPQPGRGGKNKQPTTPPTESRSKRRSYAPVRFE